MKKSSWVVLGLVIVLAIGLAWVRSSGQPKLTDEEQIRKVLQDGASAIEAKNLRRALDCVSRDYSDSAGFNFDTLRGTAIQAFRSKQEYEVTIENAHVEVSGDTATVHAQVSIRAIAGNASQSIFDSPLVIGLRKEEFKRYVFLSARKWRVTGISGLPAGLGME